MADEWGFYVQEECCTSCGLPHDEAPDFVGWHVDPAVGCCIKRQPSTQDEVEQIINAMDVAELACFRYRGNDPVIQLRIRARGHASQIDTECDFNRKRASTGPWVKELSDRLPAPTSPSPRTSRQELIAWLSGFWRFIARWWNV